MVIVWRRQHEVDRETGHADFGAWVAPQDAVDVVRDRSVLRDPHDDPGALIHRDVRRAVPPAGRDA